MSLRRQLGAEAGLRDRVEGIDGDQLFNTVAARRW